MKIISANKNGINPYFYDTIAKWLGEIDFDEARCVIVSPDERFEFNTELEEINSSYFLLDYMEYGMAEPIGGCVFGDATGQYTPPGLTNPEWFAFDDWVKRNKPLVYFKLNLKTRLMETLPNKFAPLDYTTLEVVEEPASEETWKDSRPYDVFYSWGYSNVERPRLHADIINGIVKHGIEVIDTVAYFPLWREHTSSSKTKSKWMVLYTPHYARLPLSQLLRLQSLFKVSISMPGCGPKCFRHAESPNGSIMAMIDMGMAWSYPWVHGYNCIHLMIGKEVHSLNHMLKEGRYLDGCEIDWYDLYKNSVLNCQKYQASVYSKDYILPIVKKHLEGHNG